ncbi:amino acid ABC transporter permease [Mycobacterium sp. 155]|uniref:amino acid ABC transporter permease n=1 Tax=Mycobacterium sp. 155 TaxID=1157943 RepID=UPI0003748C9D|nr:amino acid ABC transporter permease [Mycobacterium sp. 155]
MSTASVLFDAPGPRAKVRNWILTALTVVTVGCLLAFVIERMSAKDQLQPEKWKPFLTADLWRTFVLPGVEGTLTAAAVSIVFAGALGLLLGVGRLAPIAPIRWLSSVIVEFFRAIPVLIMMIFAYFLYAKFDVFPSKYLALAGVITGLSLYNGAVIAEIVRAGIHSLPRGQREAGLSLGLTWGQSMRFILLPQAITAMLPVLISQLVVVLKDTAIGYQITFVEMVRQGTNIGSAYGNYLPALVVIAILMISVNITLSALATQLEHRLRRSSRGPAPLEAEAIEQEGAPGARVLQAQQDQPRG